MPGKPQTNQAQRRADHRILIDRPIDAVFKRVLDLRAVGTALNRLQIHDASPNGDTLRAEAALVVAPLRVRFAGTAAVVEAHELSHRAVIVAEARDRDGRGKLAATAHIALRSVGSGTEVELTLDVEIAGAIVRTTGDALLDQLDAFVRAYFVALAGDVFQIDTWPDDAPLFDAPATEPGDAILDLVALETPAPLAANEPAVALFRPEPAEAFSRFVDALRLDGDGDGDTVIDLTRTTEIEPFVMAAAAQQPVAAFARFTESVPTTGLALDIDVLTEPDDTDDLEVHFDPEPINVFAAARAVTIESELAEPVTPEPVAVPVVTRSTPVRPAVSQPVAPVGLPAASIPRARGLARFRSRAAKATQTAGTVAAGAAVVAAVAGAYAARRWLGRR